MAARNKDAILLFMKPGDESFTTLGLGSHMTNADIEERLPKAVENAEFANTKQGVKVHGTADWVMHRVPGAANPVRKEILGVIGVEFKPAISADEVMRFTHALASKVDTVHTIDVVEVGHSDGARVINRVSMADVGAIATATRLELPA